MQDIKKQIKTFKKSGSVIERNLSARSKTACQDPAGCGMDPCRSIVLDTETTGLATAGFPDEILELSIIDLEGKILYSQRFHPLYLSHWPAASRVHHIYPEDLEEMPTLMEEWKTIDAILSRAETVIGYNLDFDLSFLGRFGLIPREGASCIDTMQPMAKVNGEWNTYYEDYKRIRLTRAAEICGFEWVGKPHGSLADCQATLAVYQFLQKNYPETIRISKTVRQDEIKKCLSGFRKTQHEFLQLFRFGAMEKEEYGIGSGTERNADTGEFFEEKDLEK